MVYIDRSENDQLERPMPRIAVHAQLQEFLDTVATLPAFPKNETVVADLRAVGERAAVKPRDLTYVMVFGPTGCGKSKITNSLFGRVLSPVGYRRPTTATPHIIVPGEVARTVVESLPVLPFELVELDGDGFARLVLIDTPDIDSLCAENKTIADAFLRFADAVLVVTDPSKYGDESVWRYLRSFRRNNMAFRIVVNKMRDPEILKDFAGKLREEGIEASVVSLPFQPGQDHELLAESDGLAVIRRDLRTWAASERLRHDALKRSAALALSHLTGAVVPWLDEQVQILAKLQATIDAVLEKRERSLHQGLPFTLDKETLATMYARLLAKLDRIDPFRLPRRILSYPFRLLREKLGLGSATPSQPEELREIWDLKEESFVAVALEAADDVEEALSTSRLEIGGERPSEAAIREAFRRFQSEFQNWVKAEAEELAGTLSVGQRVRFYVAQALVFGALLGVEVQTGGILTITEVVTGGVVSPFAAKLIGMALSAEESRRFQDKARQVYLRDAAKLLKTHCTYVLDALQERIASFERARSQAGDLVGELEAIAGREG